MPTYTINMQGDPAAQAWADGASALAQAFTPDYEGQAKGQALAAQADAAYARSAASLASRDKTLAEKMGIDRTNTLLANLDAEVAELKANGATDLEISQIIAEAGALSDPEAFVGNIGDYNLATAGANAAMELEPGTQEYFDALRTGSGVNYGDTYAGYKDTQTNANQLALEEAAALAAENEAKREAERQKYIWETQNKPLELSENEVAIVPQTDPRWTEENQGLIVGQRSVGNTEAILAPGSDDILVQGPGYDEEKAPDLETWQEGREKVTGFYDPTHPNAIQEGPQAGFVETARGPMTTADGKPLLTPADEAFAADDKLNLELALGNGQGAYQALNEVDQLMGLIQQGVPTGFWTNATLPWRQAAVQMGLGDEKKLAQIETVTSGLGNRVMGRIQDTKGAVSNAEMDYFRKISASIGNSPAGNLMLLEGERRVHQRNIELRELALSMRGASGEEISAALEDYKKNNPIWSPEEIANIDSMTPDPELGYETGSVDAYVNPNGNEGTTSSGVSWSVSGG